MRRRTSSSVYECLRITSNSNGGTSGKKTVDRKDVDKYTLNTPVLISISYNKGSGIWIPELKTYTPVWCYASIEQIITILNRGIFVEFPNDTKDGAISKRIENIMLEYEERKRFIFEKRGIEVGTNIDKAIEMIQDMNDSATRFTEPQPTDHEFDFTEQQNKIIADTMNIEFYNGLMNIEDPQDMSAEDRLKWIEGERKNREALKQKKHDALKDLEAETMAWSKLYLDAQYNDSDFEFYNGFDMTDALKDANKPLTNPFYRNKKKKK